MSLTTVIASPCSHRGDGRSRERAAVLCPQARAVIEAAAERDGRVSAGAHVGGSAACGLGQSGDAASDLVRAAVIMAGDAGVSRRRIAAGLSISERTLDHWMSPGEGRGPSAGAVAAMFFDGRCLPAAVRERLIEWAAECSGLALVRPQAGRDGAAVNRQLLEAQAAGGETCARAACSLAATSDGGRRITRAEASSLLTAARTQLREVAELVRTLEQIATQGDGDAGADAQTR